MDRNTVNNPNDPTAGSMNMGSLEWASASFGGDINFLKYTATTRWYIDLLHKYLIGGLFKKPLVTKWRPVVMLNGEMGYAQSLDGKRLPLSERFFLGGINSVRGFRERSLGPEDSGVIADDPDDPATGLTDVTSQIGGNKYLQGNIELLIPIVPSVGIKGVLFYDIGNAFNEHDDIRIAGLRQAVGFGFRWMSPIGPLRFEWGFPLHAREDEEKQVFEFGMGSFF
jgi:outer membrane protein insertion porin family